MKRHHLASHFEAIAVQPSRPSMNEGVVRLWDFGDCIVIDGRSAAKHWTNMLHLMLICLFRIPFPGYLSLVGRPLRRGWNELPMGEGGEFDHVVQHININPDS